MKKIYFAYADLETTYFPLPEGYDDYKDYYEKCDNPNYPKIYSWCLMFKKEYLNSVVLTKNKDELEQIGIYEEIDDDKDVYKYFGISDKSFIDFIKCINVDLKIYFNNSKGFDSHFILPALDREGYNNVIPYKTKEIESIKENNYQEIYKELRDKRFNHIYKMCEAKIQKENMSLIRQKYFFEKQWNNLLTDEYKLMTTKNNQIFQMTISTNNTYWTGGIKKNRVIQIKDNLLLFASSIKNMGKTISSYYVNKLGWDKTEAEARFHKKEIDYMKENLYNNYQEFLDDGNEKEYLEQDVFILFEFHNLLEKYLPRKEWKLTSASTSYKMWLKDFSTNIVSKYIEHNLISKVDVKNGGFKYKYQNKLFTLSQVGKKVLNEILPTKWLDGKSENFNTIHQELYQWYSGGITLVNENFRGQLVNNLSILDINSSYPKQMSLEIDAPIGVGVKGDREGYNFKLYEMYVNSEIVNEKGLPFLFNILDSKRNYRKVLKQGMIIHLNSYEYERFLKYYNPPKNSYKLETKWSFQTTKISNLFKDYIDKWYKVKSEASKEKNDVLKLIAKLFLNALYGKFGSKSIRESKLWFSQDQIWLSQEQQISSDFYLPIAISITSLARMQLVDGCGYNYHNFIYCDTDSLFVINFDKKDYNIELDKYKLGCWDIEKKDLVGLVRRPKQYYFLNPEIQTDENGNKYYNKKVAFAGMNFDKELDDLYFDDNDIQIVDQHRKILDDLKLSDFIVGKDILKQTTPFRVLAQGIIIVESVKKIKPIWDYERLPEQKFHQEIHYKKSLENIKKYEKTLAYL